VLSKAIPNRIAFFFAPEMTAPRSLALPAPAGPAASGPAKPVPPLPRIALEAAERQRRVLALRGRCA